MNCTKKGSLTPEEIQSTQLKLDFEYGPDKQRNRTVLSNKINGNWVGVQERIFGDQFEIESDFMGGIDYYHYIYTPIGLSSIYKLSNNSGSMLNVSKDHIQSIVGIFDDAGNVIERFAYDPWGRRRNPLDWSYNAVSVPLTVFRGYTGHEHIEDFGIINMNARLYDPILARMYAPDAVIPDIENTQAYNRYSYVLNNPLKFTDPTGNFNFIPFLVFAAYNIGSNIIQHSIRSARDPLYNYNAADIFADIGIGFASAAFGEYVRGLLNVEHLGGFIGGSIQGGSMSLFNSTLSYSYNSINNPNNADFVSDILAPTLTGAVLGGLAGGIDAQKEGFKFINGESRTSSVKFVTEGNNLSSNPQHINIKEGDNKFHINQGFEKDLQLQISNPSRNPMTLTYDKQQITIPGRTMNRTYTIPAGTKSININKPPQIVNMQMTLSTRRTINSSGQVINSQTSGVGQLSEVRIFPKSSFNLQGQWRGFSGLYGH